MNINQIKKINRLETEVKNYKYILDNVNNKGHTAYVFLQRIYGKKQKELYNYYKYLNVLK